MQSYKPKEWVNKTSSNAAIPAQTQAATSVDNIDSSAYFKTGVVSSAAGSSYYEFGGTKVICAVYGPLPSLKAQSFDRGVLVCEFEFAPFASSSITSASASASSSSGAAVSAVAAGPGAVINASASASAGTAGRRRRGGRQDPEESLNASMLHDALSVAVRLDRFPKHEVQVLVQVLERNGGELAAAINAAVVALADSGIEMLDLAAAATVAYDTKAGVIVTPSFAQMASRRCRGTLTMSCLPTLNQVSFIHQTGALSIEQSESLITAANKQCADMVAAITARLIKTATQARKAELAAASTAEAIAAALGDQ